MLRPVFWQSHSVIQYLSLLLVHGAASLSKLPYDRAIVPEVRASCLVLTELLFGKLCDVLGTNVVLLCDSDNPRSPFQYRASSRKIRVEKRQVCRSIMKMQKDLQTSLSQPLEVAQS